MEQQPDPFAPPEHRPAAPPAPGWGPPPAPPVRPSPPPDVLVLSLVIAALLVIGLGAAAFKAGNDDGPARAGGGVGEADCEDVRDFPGPIDASHAQGLVEYDSDPPYGGRHAPSPLPAIGFFPRDRAPLDIAERAVHNLEHGYVVVWYDAGADDESLRRLAGAVRESPGKVIAVPWRGEVREGKHFTMAAWGHLQTCEQPTAGAIEAFYAEHGGPNGEAPEKNAL